MRSPIAVLLGRYHGISRREIARRTVPCLKFVVRPEADTLSLCVLVDGSWLYRWPHEDVSIDKDLALKARLLKGDMEHLRLREFQPGLCRYVRPREKTAATP
ncbi:MAG TPA: hypothetical protein VMU49_03150 [Candidatus Acidoferrales bacterium]|nr:hypothetical protein [Candidatus Acidoferrales bacterium]